MREKGFTIVEVLIAISFLTVGVVAVIATLMSSYKTVSMSQGVGIGSRAATAALEHIKGQKDFGLLYNNFKTYQKNYVSPTQGPFAVMEDGSIDWNTDRVDPNTPPTFYKIAGYGWFKFVTNETDYPTTEWGKSTAYNTNTGGSIDLDGDGTASDTALVLGRTTGTPAGTGNRYMTLPVTVTIRIFERYGKSSGGGKNEVEVVRKSWLLDNQEN